MLMQAVVAGALAGLASGPHCAAMCGPLCAASCGAPAAGSGTRALRYQLGRVVAYAFVGSVAAQLGALIEASWLVSTAPVLLSVGVAIALLLLALRLWRGASEPLVPLRAVRRATPGRWTRLLALLPREPAALGALSALLPCGALAAGLLLAAASSHRLAGALLMGAFAITSAAFVLGGGALLTRLSVHASRRASRALALALVLAAVVVSALPLVRTGTSTHSTHAAEASCH
ncbi:MAG: sulfite exporter TauE/SafE family protein [Myxococcales bacterium]|nr:sulfite exporter TauE/SafE family protein [Myxococcales bacterium]